MQRLSGMDASFLYLETPSMLMHVTGTIVLDPAGMEGGYRWEAFKEMLAERIHLLPPFRRRLVTVPFGLGHPVWIEDPDFDLDAHVRRAAVPAPGSMHELAEIVGDLAGRPLDRSRPLWEMWVVEGLADGHIAIVTKMHHSAIDGASGADLMAHIFDLDPDDVTVPPDDGSWQPEQAPSDLSLAAKALATQATSPVRMVRLMGKTVGSMADIVRQRVGRPSDAVPSPMPFGAPRTPFSGAITSHRSVAFARTSLDDFKHVKNAFGTTVNDVVLAASAVSLRHWLIDRGGLPDKPLVASVPVSVRGDDSEGLGNQVSAMLVNLPVQLDDPAAILGEIQQNTKGAKELHGAIGADMLQDWSEFAPPAVLARVARFYSSWNLADHHAPMHNLVISNMPGPPIPLYCAGARVLSTYPMGPVMEGAGLNITVLSNMGNVDFGAIACRELVPDIWDIATGFSAAVDELVKLADQRA
ncbi:wax ester/triacylglycerol synthase family O-acyltransferase [soil metagenome]